MARPIIQIRGLGKRYSLSHHHQPDSLKGYLKSLFGRPRLNCEKEEEFWALKDVTLTLEEGQCLALIGKNGSGKSTLLKILSRVIAPTAGSVIVYGKVASLLEVGTGFHPELTGRENIFLNGAMLGCSETEIRQRFDAIVAFSGVERFLDTPVKHFSSGMYVRLAYAVAAHVDADVLLVDEVLAVGDADFQRKCFAHMEQLLTKRKTCILVSHDMDVVTRLATHLSWVDNGRIKATDTLQSGLLEEYISIA